MVFAVNHINNLPTEESVKYVDSKKKCQIQAGSGRGGCQNLGGGGAGGNKESLEKG